MTDETKPEDPKAPDPEQIRDSNQKSLEKIRSLMDSLKSVEEHEKKILEVNGSMHARPKSEGMLQFERQIAELEKRVERGELPEPRAAFLTIWRNTVPRMTPSERREVERLILNAHRAAELVSL